MLMVPSSDFDFLHITGWVSRLSQSRPQEVPQALYLSACAAKRKENRFLEPQSKEATSGYLKALRKWREPLSPVNQLPGAV